MSTLLAAIQAYPERFMDTLSRRAVHTQPDAERKLK